MDLSQFSEALLRGDEEPPPGFDPDVVFRQASSGMKLYQLMAKVRFINPAKRGNGLSIGCLYHLFKHQEAPRLYNDILDIYFTNLKADEIPPSDVVDQKSPLALANLERGLESARGLAAYIRLCFDAPPRRRQSLVVKLRLRMSGRLPDIFPW
ncbi:hypothetical protein BKA70DRAFT_1300565, partial [Coprinopsis sp. MPI-PUGE-AT-0042]